jgi:hypothetical protein
MSGLFDIVAILIAAVAVIWLPGVIVIKTVEQLRIRQAAGRPGGIPRQSETL